MNRGILDQGGDVWIKTLPRNVREAESACMLYELRKGYNNIESELSLKY